MALRHREYRSGSDGIGFTDDDEVAWMWQRPLATSTFFLSSQLILVKRLSPKPKVPLLTSPDGGPMTHLTPMSLALLFACGQSTERNVEPDDPIVDDQPSCEPSAEVCDGVDNDCDGETDEEAEDAPTFFADLDGDGFGDAFNTIRACAPPQGFVDTDGDCNDALADVNPGEVDVCDGIDHDCDPTTGHATLFTDDGAVDFTDALAGTADEPAVVVLDTPGTLRICEGTYFARLDVQANVDIEGVAGSELTVLDGGGGGTVLTYVTEDVEAQLVGLTVQNGRGADEGNCRAGGICVTASTLEGEDVVLRDNISSGAGGGLAVSRATVTLTDAEFVDNEAGSGGAIRIEDDGRATITDGLFAGNLATGSGGAASLTSGEARLILETVTLDGNSATQDGGAIASDNSRLVSLVDSRIVNNTAGRNGGGLSIVGSSSAAVFENCEIVGNTAERGAAVNMSKNTTLKFTDVFGNVATNETSAAIRVTGGTLVLENTNFEDPIDGTDNAPADIVLDGRQLNFGLGVSDSCTVSVCRSER